MQKRWPHWVYGEGEEPDYRFSFANERTFLAWIRTALALLAGGVALDTIDVAISVALQTALSALLLVLGLACAVMSWLRWAQAERAMRRGTSLPSSSLAAVLSVVIVAVAVAVLVAGV